MSLRPDPARAARTRPPDMIAEMIVLVGGVAGSGKTTGGAVLAGRARRPLPAAGSACRGHHRAPGAGRRPGGSGAGARGRVTDGRVPRTFCKWLDTLRETGAPGGGPGHRMRTGTGRPAANVGSCWPRQRGLWTLEVWRLQ